MGSARHRSWSHSRQRFADGCPRALYFGYFLWGDPKQNQARFLKRAATVDSLAGTIIHRMLTIGLRELVRRKSYPVGLASNGCAQYDEALKEGKRIATIGRAGKRPIDAGTCLFHHLYGVEDLAAEERGRSSIIGALNSFETSTALGFLSQTNFDRRETPLTSTDDIPWFLTDGELGFSRMIGLRIYANYDLALHCGDEFHVIDWKKGRKSEASLACAKRQLAVYGLWAMSIGIPIEAIRLQAYYLLDGEPWAPQPLDVEDIKNVITQIEAQDEFERMATTIIAKGDGEIVRYEADQGDFPTRPDLVRCGWCPFQSICADAAEHTPRSTVQP